MKKILILTTLICGLVLTSITKNKTRSLEKKLVDLDHEIEILSSDLAEANLDFEYLTAPKNISYLAHSFLDESFSHYSRSQIIKLYEKQNVPNNEITKIKRKTNFNNLEKKKKNNDFDQLIAGQLFSKNSYASKTISGEEIYKNNGNKKEKVKVDDLNKAQRWAVIQIIKAFFGFPIVPMK